MTPIKELAISVVVMVALVSVVFYFVEKMHADARKICEARGGVYVTITFGPRCFRADALISTDHGEKE